MKTAHPQGRARLLGRPRHLDHRAWLLRELRLRSRDLHRRRRPGRGARRAGGRRRSRSGASDAIIEDLTPEFVRDYVWPALRAGAMYEGRYLLGTALARPVLALGQVQAARRVGADAVAHGCTGKGNDQLRFELDYRAAGAGSRTSIAPWREWDIASREDALAYAEKHGIPVPVSRGVALLARPQPAARVARRRVPGRSVVPAAGRPLPAHRRSAPRRPTSRRKSCCASRRACRWRSTAACWRRTSCSPS